MNFVIWRSIIKTINPFPCCCRLKRFMLLYLHLVGYDNMRLG